MNKDLRMLVKTQLTKHEGMRLKPYKCSAGKLTIGIGRNLEDRGINRAEALFMLNNDIDECEEHLLNTIPHIYEPLSEIRKSILINMCFNLGIHGLLKFKKMISALEHQDYEQASYEMLDSKWAKQVGNRALELADLMKKG